MSGLYIHIPFCASKCYYCDFYSMPLKSTVIAKEYANALINEFNLRKDELNGPINTIYIGGGTPSQLPIEALKHLVTAINQIIIPENESSSIAEFTIEANPEDITSQWVKTVSSLGINRVSIGIQSFADKELSDSGRRHNAQKALDAISIIQDAGITEISGDLIYGLPGQTETSWEKSLEQIMNLNLPHISAYSLSYEPGTRLSAMLQAGKIEPVSEETCVAMYKRLIDTMKGNGYEHYEISNFARPGHRAKHNCAYWDFIPYLGLGPGAYSFDGKKRRSNPPNLKKYLTALTHNKTAFIEETESQKDLINDYIITALRKSEGIDMNAMSEALGEDAVKTILKDARRFVEHGDLIADNGHLKFTEESWLISDMILRDLLQ